ncbi:MAG TPA: AMP-binding protein [Terriglobales bacterium]|nr:AMP-binding protein [Terriglobales bacterium]
MTFLENIFDSLERAGDRTVLQELRDGKASGVSGRELLREIYGARVFLRSLDLKAGERCALLAPNSIRWTAVDLAIMAEGLILVPLYARQDPSELVAMMKDCSPSAIFCGESTLRDGIAKNWADAPKQYLFDDIFAYQSQEASAANRGVPSEAEPVTIIYTSGTSGESKGVVLNAGNIGYMLQCTSGRLDILMKSKEGQDRVFHYLPFCFAGSWIMLLTCLLRGSLLTLNTDLTKLAGDMRTAAPDYFLNVPQLLERMRKGVDEQLWKTGGLVQTIYSRAKSAWMRKQEGQAKSGDAVWLAIARALVFPVIRKKMLGENLKALICGSAPLNVDTQLFFMMLEIPVLQVYGLTETTAICTMDDPRRPVPGRVGPAIPGVEMKLGENDEIVVRGPNIFPGYWKRPQETASVLREEWFHTGDQGEVDAEENWRIVGRIKNLIILGSGHNIAPEPIEDKILAAVPRAQQAVLAGNGRSYLSVIVTGTVTADDVQRALDAVNAGLPHYKQVRAFYIHPEPFSVENGLLTANGKLKRDLISQRLWAEIEGLYALRKSW